MYKAGDFTNGKMNEIFKKSFKFGESSIYDSSVKINHKQLGVFHLVSDGAILLPTLLMLGDVGGFYGYAKSFMKEHNDLLEDDDPSKFSSVVVYIGALPVPNLLNIANGFFNKYCEDDLEFDFSDLFCLLNYLVSEKDCTYSSVKK